MFITESERKTSVAHETEVTVCGGGIAGVSAALAAARCGKKVILIEREYSLGGLATLGLVTIYLPLCDGMGHQVCFGIAEELLRLSGKYGFETGNNNPWIVGGTAQEKTKERYSVRYSANVCAILMEQLLVDNGVKLLYGTSVCDTVVKDGKISHLIIENKSGRSAIATESVIDATGDADICKQSGENTVVFGNGNIPASWYYDVKNGKYNLNELGFCESAIPEDEKEIRKKRFVGLDGDELSDLTVLSHRDLLNDFIKNGDNVKDHSLATIAAIPQVRMTRRIDGVYVQDDIEIRTRYNDSVGLFSDWRKAGPVYEMPYSTLYGKKISNLITAGRCISVTDNMWDITRVIPVCAVSGQAAGTAAALCNDFKNADILMLQSKLKEDGVKIHIEEI